MMLGNLPGSPVPSLGREPVAVETRTLFFPGSREEPYPRQLGVDFTRLKVNTLKKYIKSQDLSVRPDSSAAEYAVAVAKHFHTYLPVSEDESLKKFMNYLKMLPPTEATKRAALKRDRDAKVRKVSRLSGKEGKEDVAVEEADDSQQLYCICHRPSFGDMIGCDDDACPYEWFHLPCVNITPGTRPAGHWYCPECRDRRAAESNRKTNRGGKRARGAAKEDPKRK